VVAILHDDLVLGRRLLA